MSTYRNKCGVSGILQGKVAGDLLETRLTKATIALSAVCHMPCVHFDVSQI